MGTSCSQGVALGYILAVLSALLFRSYGTRWTNPKFIEDRLRGNDASEWIDCDDARGEGGTPVELLCCRLTLCTNCDAGILPAEYAAWTPSSGAG